MNQVYGGSRFSLTHEEWLDVCVSDPSAYGMTLEAAIAQRNEHYANKPDITNLIKQLQGKSDGTPQET